MFRILAPALGIQLALGGLVTYNFIDPSVHIVWGIVLGVIALVTLIFVMRMPSKPKRLVGLAVGIGVDILLQGLLGFTVLGTSSNVNLSNGIAWVHFLNALVIFAMTLLATTMAMMAGRMAQHMGPSPQVPQP